MKISKRTKRIATATCLLAIGSTVSMVADMKEEIKLQNDVICDLADIVSYLDKACFDYENFISIRHGQEMLDTILEQ